jgi:hypothetical protein
MPRGLSGCGSDKVSVRYMRRGRSLRPISCGYFGTFRSKVNVWRAFEKVNEWPRATCDPVLGHGRRFGLVAFSVARERSTRFLSRSTTETASEPTLSRSLHMILPRTRSHLHYQYRLQIHLPRHSIFYTHPAHPATTIPTRQSCVFDVQLH